MIIESYYPCLLLILTLGANRMEASTIRLQKRYTQDDICHTTYSTLSEVKRCPCTEQEIHDRRQEKGCHKYPQCQGEQLEYHCVKDGARLVEVCAPKALITGQCCTLFNEGVGRIIEDPSRLCSKCPFDYNSTDIRSQLECLQSAKTTERSVAQTTIKRKSSVETLTTHQPNHYKMSKLLSVRGIQIQYADSSKTESDNTQYANSSQTESHLTGSTEKNVFGVYLFLLLFLIPVIISIYLEHKYKLCVHLKDKLDETCITRQDNDKRENKDIKECTTPLAEGSVDSVKYVSHDKTMTEEEKIKI